MRHADADAGAGAVLPPILIGGIQHETNAFSPIATGLSDFLAYQYAEGGVLLERYRDTGTEMGGMIAEAERQGAPVIPTLFAAATPSGQIDAETFAVLKGRLCTLPDRAPEPKAAAIALHGSMTVQGCERADVEVLRAVRRRLGPDALIVATFDLHANLSDELVEAADLLVGYRTFPHHDMRERGVEAMAHLIALLRGAPRPLAALRKLPLLPASEKQVTDRAPMRAIMEAAARLRARSGIAACSLATGYPFADGADLGMSVLVYGDGPAAGEAADALAQMIWRRRAKFRTQLVPLDRAVARARAAPAPVVMVDAADNVGGGAPGDSTALLQAILAGGLTGAVVVLWDPAAAAMAARCGAGGPFSARVGAHSGPASGVPLQVSGTVLSVGPRTYLRSGSYMPGTRVDMGLTAVLRIGDCLLVLTSARVMPFDRDHLTAVGIDPGSQRIIVVKSGSAWRAAFGDLARTVINVDAPGVATQCFARLPYRNRTRALYPIAADAEWPAQGGTERNRAR